MVLQGSRCSLPRSITLALAALLLGASLLLTGCANFTAAAPTAAPAAAALGGRVYGGRQPIAGALVQVYAAGATGYGSAATLLATTTTNGAGGFSFPAGSYACPSTAGTPTVSQTLYLTSTGGMPTTGIVNTNAVLMAVLGDCGTVLATQPNVVMNEVTTVAGMVAMQQFASISGTPATVNLGTSVSNIIGLQNAAATVNNLVTLSSGFAVTSQVATGAIPGYTTPPSVTITPETTKMNTLADILASCVNSAGAASSTCQTLFSNVSSNPVTDTLQAAYYLATNPTSTVSGTSRIGTLYNLVSAQSPYQSIVTTAPLDWTIGLTYGSTSSQAVGNATTYLLTDPGYLGIDVGGNVWIANSKTDAANTAGNSVTELSPVGVPKTQVLTAAGQITGPRALILNPNSDVFVSNYGSNAAPANSIVEYTVTGVTKTFLTGAGPGPLASDGAGNIFVETAIMPTAVSSAPPAQGAAQLEGIAANAASGSNSNVLATGATAGQFSGLVVDGNETIYLSNQTNGTVVYLGNAMTNTFAAQGTTTAGGQGVAEGLALDGSNNVYVGSYSETAGSGTLSEVLASNPATGNGPFRAGSLAGVQKLLIDGAGNLWVTSFPADAGTLSEFTPAGVALSPAATGFAHNFKGALGLAIDRSGNVWVGNSGAAATSTQAGYINEVVGAAAPVTTPLSAELPGTAGNNTRIGQRP